MSISGMPGNSEHLHNRIIELQRVASLPNGLRACNVQKSRIPELAKDAAMQWTGKFNPRQLTEKEFIHLYESAF
jgi:alcohol dehydrogenase